ncbi:MAG: M23 family metallopeptidase [Gammaproteobacteria bacterium]|nr:M23 family metallopeptidase [Gammaproteobacteria bacterium]MYD81058.1 M23 family metallopeptidase [Gammaproteobacteria bacterium]
MQKNIKKLSVCILVVVLCSLLPSCSTLKPAPVVDRSPGMDQQLSGNLRTYRYIVKSGDTLYAISKLHGLTVAQIAEMNGLEPPYTIIPNQVLVVTPSRVLWQENIAAEENSNWEIVPARRQPEDSRSKPTPTVVTQQSSATIAQSNTNPAKPPEVRKAEKTPIRTQDALQDEKPAITTVSIDVTGEASSTTTEQPVDVGEVETVAQEDSPSLDSLPKGWEWPVNTRPTKPKGNDDGLTYFLNRGTNVVAAASGRVSYAGVALSDYRYMVLVKTPDNYVIQYDFNTELKVKENDIVSKGQPLIRISNKGVPKSEDEDLYRQIYFAIWHKAVPQDPNKLIGR